MNDLSRHPTRHPAPSAGECDSCCDLCGAVPVRALIHGDRMCGECADKWAAVDPNDDLVPISKLIAMGALPVKGF